MLNEMLMWNKIGRIVVRLAERLNIAPERALDIFYSSETNARLHNPKDFLYLMSDLYVVDEVVKELEKAPSQPPPVGEECEG